MEDIVREYQSTLNRLIRRKAELLLRMHRFDRRVQVLEEEIEEVADILYQLKTHSCRTGG